MHTRPTSTERGWGAGRLSGGVGAGGHTDDGTGTEVGADTDRRCGERGGTGSAVGRTWAGGGPVPGTRTGAMAGRTSGQARPRCREIICGGTRDQQERSGARERRAGICDGAHKRQRDNTISVGMTSDPGGCAAADAPASHTRTSGSASQATGRDHGGGAWRGARRGGGRDGRHNCRHGCSRGGDERVACGG